MTPAWPATVPDSEGRPFGTLGEVLERWRAVDADATALITEHESLTVAQLADLADAQSQTVAAHTPPGSRVAIHAANSASFVAALYAIPAAGRVLVPLNTRLTDAECVAQLERANVELLLGDPIDGFTGSTAALERTASHDKCGPADPPRPTHGVRAPTPEDTAWIIFTSGSTGTPKGVLVTHASLAAAVATTAAARPLGDDEVYLYPFPLFHIAAYNVIHAHTRRRPVVLPSRFDPHRIIELCHTHRVTAMSVAATMLRMLLDALADGPDPGPPPTLRTIAYGAAPMSETLLREADEILACDFAQGYGSTELSGNAVFLGPAQHRRGLAGETRFLTAAGYPGPGVDVRIAAPTVSAPANVGMKRAHDAQNIPTFDEGSGESGESGEILIRGAQVCAGYLDDPGATAAAITGGWLHTGDIGTVDDDGLVHIVDRAKDIVVTGGENVASREVEDRLRTHAQVADVAVVGLPDPRWGEAVSAVVVLRADAATTAAPQPIDGIVDADPTIAEELRRHVTASLAGYKKPRNVFIANALPLNANGKVDKVALRRLLRAM